MGPYVPAGEDIAVIIDQMYVETKMKFSIKCLIAV